MAELCRPERAAGDAVVEKLGIPGGKDSNPGKAAAPGAWRLPVNLSNTLGNIIDGSLKCSSHNIVTKRINVVAKSQLSNLKSYSI